MSFINALCDPVGSFLRTFVIHQLCSLQSNTSPDSPSPCNRQLLETNILAELSFRQHEDNFDKNFFFFVSVKFSRAHFLSIQLWGPVAEIMTPKNNIPLTENKIDGRKHTGSGHGGNLSELPLVVDDRKCLQPCNYLGKFD